VLCQYLCQIDYLLAIVTKEIRRSIYDIEKPEIRAKMPLCINDDKSEIKRKRDVFINLIKDPMHLHRIYNESSETTIIY